MVKKQKNTVANETDSGLKNAVLNEKELENVSGGFEMPTIIDLCQNKYNYDICFNALWGGMCKNFSVVFVKEEKDLFMSQTRYYYTMSCAKGCFKDQPYMYVK